MQDNQPLLDVLTREGVLINVSVRYWRATQKLKPEDLNLNPENVTDRLISLGHKKLLPRERLQSFALIESRAHALIDSGTFPFLNGLGHFLPNRKLQEVTDRLGSLEREFNQARREFLGRYAELRQQAAGEWLTAARRLVNDPERLVAGIEASFPAPEKMERCFGFTTQLFQIRVPETLDLQAVSIGDQEKIARAREQAAQQAASQIHENARRFVSDCVATLREQTAQLCEDMLASIRDGKTGVHQRTLNRLIRFIDEFKKMNFVGDQQMEAQLEQVRKEFLSRTAEEYRASASARVQLKGGLSELRDHARQLGQQDARELVERFGALGRRRFHLAA
jgi:hypothetical protein